jgi:alpha-tubulin suppressor-like RCC1 family protein
VGNHSFIKFCCGSAHTIAIKEDGSAWSWGRNNVGQLGNYTTLPESSPISVFGNYSFIQVSGGSFHTCALKSDGSVWTWGYNDFGQLGINESGAATSRSSPVSVIGDHSFLQIFSGREWNLALKSDGSVWSWGKADYGQLGTNSRSHMSSPVSVYKMFN